MRCHFIDIHRLCGGGRTVILICTVLFQHVRQVTFSAASGVLGKAVNTFILADICFVERVRTIQNKRVTDRNQIE